MRLLFVCTGNLCRSPVAEGLTAAWLRAAGADGAEAVSAGTNAPVGRPMDPSSAAALLRLGGNPGPLRAAALTPAVTADADLVLTMTREHRRAVLEMAPRSLRRTFTLLEAADLLRSADVEDVSRLPVDERARELGRRLDARRALRATSAADDIEDPIGRRPAVHQAVADTIAEALRPLLWALFPAPLQRPARPRPESLPLRN